MQIHNIAGYKFIALSDIPTLRVSWLTKCNELALKGTILLSPEGINVSLSGKVDAIATFKRYIEDDARFTDMTYRESYSAFQPFDRMKVKIKKEIITLRHPEIRPDTSQAPVVTPQELKQWLDEKRDITVLDTRNDYEVRFGTFKAAKNLHIKDFCEFPEAVKTITRDKPLVMFCTGGIRCEKAALHLVNEGFPEVFQLQGGILNYFAQVGGAHYDGDCYVFDKRVALDANLLTTGAGQCQKCQGPTTQNAEAVCLSCVNI